METTGSGGGGGGAKTGCIYTRLRHEMNLGADGGSAGIGNSFKSGLVRGAHLEMRARPWPDRFLIWIYLHDQIIVAAAHFLYCSF